LLCGRLPQNVIEPTEKTAPPAVVPKYTEKDRGPGKQPYALALADRGIMVLAGLWENWRLPADEWVRTFAIVTTTPNELCAEIHNRMPVILKPEAWPVWLAEQPATRRR
jgi:putative SOS response-associated peptidase YedK